MLVAPERPSIEAAAIFVTPRSMAWATMWKIGPEWAMQQPKWTRATPRRRGSGARPRGSCRRSTASSARRAARPIPRTVGDPVLGPIHEIPDGHGPDDPGEAAEQGEGRPPPERGDQAAGRGRHDEDPSPMPLERMPMARPRRAENQRVAVAESGT